MGKMMELSKELKHHIANNKQMVAVTEYNNTFFICVSGGIERYENVKVWNYEKSNTFVHLHVDVSENITVKQVVNKPELRRLFPDLAKEVLE